MSSWRQRDWQFAPHDFRPTMMTLDGRPMVIPKIFITPEALARMYHYVDIASTEVGWLGTVRKLGNDYLIDQVFLFRQVANATITDITTDGLAEFTLGMLDKPEGDDVIDNLRFWGHSHVYMETNPSPQDERQVDVWRKAKTPWLIRGIFNKKGRAQFTIFDFERGFKIVDAEWALAYKPDSSLRGEISAEFDQKVREYGYHRRYEGPTYAEIPELEPPVETEDVDLEPVKAEVPGSATEAQAMAAVKETVATGTDAAASDNKELSGLGEKVEQILEGTPDVAPPGTLPAAKPATTAKSKKPERSRWSWLWRWIPWLS